jgi:beta-galactosidase
MKKVVVFVTLIVFIFSLFATFSLITINIQAAYTPPANNRLKFNFDYDWKFIKQDITGAEGVSFNDSAWLDVSLPHTYNDIDHYDTWVTSAGDYGYMGKAWYRKHFRVDAAYSGRKVILEFEGIRQAGEFYINGTWIGRHENGTGPCGLDITNYVNFSADNILAVKVNNSLGYNEVATGTSFQGDCPNFNPMYGGIVKNVYLHITDKVYQTFPLYSGLGTSGTYVYATNINISAKTADITTQFEMKNDNATAQSVSWQMDFVDRDGNSVLTRTGGPQQVNAGQTTTVSLTGGISNAHFWSPDYPYLYTVYTTLKVNGTTVDVTPITFGIRKVSFSVAGGLMLNDIPIYLKGFAPRTTMEWPCVGQAVNWMEEYDLKMIKDCNGNFIRPMHVGPKKADVDGADKLGIIYVCPANDTELDATGRQWDQRVELMRDLTIYYRNHPSVLIYEAGNGGVSYDHMTQMLAVRNQWDPYGGRLSGDRTPPADTKTICEYWASMDVPATSNLVPVFDAEYSRTECPRRVWDNYSPPSYGYRNIANPSNVIDDYPTDSFKLNSSEDLARMNVKKYNDRWSKRGGQGLSSIMVGGAKIIFADSISHGRMIDTELARVSGAVDGARLPKETYFALQVAHNPNPQVHILGHWNYPAGTVKNMYVISSCQQVKLFTYNTSGGLIQDYGYGTRANNFEFGFTNVAWQAGKVKAIGYNGGVQVAEQEIITAGAPAKLKLTPIIGPEGFRADGSDVAMFDVEVIDSNGNRCPTDEARVDFTYSGQGRFLGGYNSGIQNSIFQNYLSTECGINRVFVRSTRTAGSFTLTASRGGLQSATATINSTAFTVTNGLTLTMPRGYPSILGAEPTPPPPTTPTPTPTPGGATSTPTPTPVTNEVMIDFAYTGTHGSSLTPPLPDAHVVHNAQAGMQVYVDNSCTFPALPSYLTGGDYIQAFLRDAADNSSTDLYQFAANRYCYIYQLIDAANQMPNHQNNANYGWTMLAGTIVINGRTHNIYKSRLMAPGELGYFASNGYGITLAPNSNLYVVLAVSAEHEIQNPNQTVTAGSTQTGNDPNKVIDGNTTTRWCAADATFPQWVKIDLGQKCSIGGYEINWYNNAGRSYKYKIELSDDDAAYNLSIDRQNNTTTGITTDRTNTINCREGRFVKITVTGSSAGWASISEIKISGVEGGSSPTPTPPGPTVTPTPTRPPATATPTPTPPGLPSTPTPTPTGLPSTPTPTGTATLLSLGKTATASSYQVGNEVAKGNDGSLTTRWTAADGTFPQWWKVDLGTGNSLNRVDINWYYSATRSFKYKIEVSTDNTTFTTVVDKTGNTITGDTSDSFVATGRYVRITVTGSSYGWASAYEFKVYGN